MTSNSRCFAISTATRAALGRFDKSGDALSSGDAAEHSSGNGSIMRLAPVPIRYARLATESSLTTHASEQCCSACRYMALVLAGLLHRTDRDEVLAPDWQPLVALLLNLLCSSGTILLSALDHETSSVIGIGRERLLIVSVVSPGRDS